MNTEKRKLRVVVDTNVIISALNFGGLPDQIFYLAIKREIELYLSSFILEEVYGVLVKKFGWRKSTAKKVLELLGQIGQVFSPTERIFAVKADDSDNRILECAKECLADYIISGDKHLLSLKKYLAARIVSPAKFLEILKKKKTVF